MAWLNRASPLASHVMYTYRDFKRLDIAAFGKNPRQSVSMKSPSLDIDNAARQLNNDVTVALCHFARLRTRLKSRAFNYKEVGGSHHQWDQLGSKDADSNIIILKHNHMQIDDYVVRQANWSGNVKDITRSHKSSDNPWLLWSIVQNMFQSWCRWSCGASKRPLWPSAYRTSLWIM